MPLVSRQLSSHRVNVNPDGDFRNYGVPVYVKDPITFAQLRQCVCTAFTFKGGAGRMRLCFTKDDGSVVVISQHNVDVFSDAVRACERSGAPLLLTAAPCSEAEVDGARMAGEKRPRQSEVAALLEDQAVAARRAEEFHKAGSAPRHSRFVDFSDGSVGNGLFTDAEFNEYMRRGTIPSTSRFTGSRGLAHEAEKDCRAREMATRTATSIEEFYREAGGGAADGR